MKNIHFIDSIEHFLNSFNKGSILLLVDENIFKIHNKLFKKYNTISIIASEENKQLSTIEIIINKLIEQEVHKDTQIIGIGGGITTDITGLVASIYKRGLKFGFIPTTLLSMCDASIGGKNGVNFGLIKNIIGTIKQPEFIAICPLILETLPEKEWKSGFGEIIKHAFLDNSEHFNYLIDNSKLIKNHNEDIIETLVKMSIETKVKIVEQDEFETGKRFILNFGHTIAHAIETSSQYTHGECVAFGILADTKIAVNLKICNPNIIDLIKEALITYDLPTQIPFKTDEVMKLIMNDKKMRQNHIKYVLPFDLGDCRIVEIEVNDLKKQLTIIENE